MKNTCKASSDAYIEMLDGIERKTLVYGERALLSEFRLTGGKTIPRHCHPEEQIGYLVSGHMVLSFGGVEYDMRPGDAWVVPGGLEHSANIIEDSVAVEAFAPVRQDYLP